MPRQAPSPESPSRRTDKIRSIGHFAKPFAPLAHKRIPERHGITASMTRTFKERDTCWHAAFLLLPGEGNLDIAENAVFGSTFIALFSAPSRINNPALRDMPTLWAFNFEVPGTNLRYLRQIHILFRLNATHSTPLFID